MKMYSIKPLAYTAGFSASTIRRYEKEWGHIFKPRRVEVGDQEYRVYTWTEIEMLIYVKIKLDEGYEIDEAWQSCKAFFDRRNNSAKILNESLDMVKADLEFWGLEQPPSESE